MVVGSTGDGEAVVTRHRQIADGVFGRVLAVMRFEGVETRAREIGNQIVAANQAGMRERRDAVGRMNLFEDVARRWTDPRDERRLASLQILVERLTCVRDHAFLDKRAGDPWTPRRLRRIVLARTKDRVDVERDAHVCETLHHLPDAIDAIEAHSWPGNVRELENVIRRAVIMTEGATIKADDVGISTGANAVSMLNLRQVREDAERNAVLGVLGRVNGNLSKAAELLGISRPTLYDLMHRFGLK